MQSIIFRTALFDQTRPFGAITGELRGETGTTEIYDTRDGRFEVDVRNIEVRVDFSHGTRRFCDKAFTDAKALNDALRCLSANLVGPSPLS